MNVPAIAMTAISAFFLGSLFGDLRNIQATTQAGTTQPQAQVEPAIGFVSESGIIFNGVKPAATADFELVLGRIKDALAKSPNPVRRQQAASWKVYKSSEPSLDGSVMYLFVFESVVKGAEYDPLKILEEVFPTELNIFYEKLKGVELRKAGLTKLMDMSAAGMKEIQN